MYAHWESASPAAKNWTVWTAKSYSGKKRIGGSVLGVGYQNSSWLSGPAFDKPPNLTLSKGLQGASILLLEIGCVGGCLLQKEMAESRGESSLGAALVALDGDVVKKHLMQEELLEQVKVVAFKIGIAANANLISYLVGLKLPDDQLSLGHTTHPKRKLELP